MCDMFGFEINLCSWPPQFVCLHLREMSFQPFFSSSPRLPVLHEHEQAGPQFKIGPVGIEYQ